MKLLHSELNCKLWINFICNENNEICLYPLEQRKDICHRNIVYVVYVQSAEKRPTFADLKPILLDLDQSGTARVSSVYLAVHLYSV